MAPDNFELGIQALLDGRPVPFVGSDSGPSASVQDPLRVVDALARAHRTAIFGKDIPPDRPVSAHWGHLELRGEIGRGASGTVYRAWDPRLARQVALKLLASDAEPGDAALEEGRLLARLNHPHIVRVFGADSHDGIAGIWMEILEGETLDEILARDGVFGAEETLLIGLDLARALSAVHSAGLLHRDIKARNVLRERGGRVVLMDLGAGRPAKHIDGSDATGTPLYMAPEVLAGSPATVQSDLYCLGVLLFRLLTGSYPVTAANLEELGAAHAAQRYTPLGALRPDLGAVVVSAVSRACHAEARARHESAAELEAALAASLQRLVAERISIPSSTSRMAAAWRRTGLVAATTVALILLAAGASWDTTIGRAARRRVGLQVPPVSTLYVTMNGAMAIVRRGRLEVTPYNPATATVVAASSEWGVRTMAGIPPSVTRGAFRLDGTPIAFPASMPSTLCCFADGTTDGRFNYSARQDSTLLEPIGSRPLAPAGVYRFDLDWSNPTLVFPLVPDGTYFGIAYAAVTDSFWVTRKIREGAAIEQWSRDGRHLNTPVNLPTAYLTGIAVDPRDGTLWAVRSQAVAGVTRLENFTTSGLLLGFIDLEQPFLVLEGAGLEFAWTGPSN